MQEGNDPPIMSATGEALERSRRRWPVRVAACLVLLVALAITYSVWRNRLDFPYEGAEGTVAAVEQVTVRDPGGTCGPLIVSIWEPAIAGQWNRTHNGSAVGDSFSRDTQQWWKIWQTETYFTGVPCALNAETTFTLPSDVKPGVVAVCDSARRCAKLKVE
ncbi:MAG: hypothetical protein KDA95_02120 [Acidimicrobiales bacterium]|nr:hypothetical protein [Acidimicrobiales bacterium]